MIHYIYAVICALSLTFVIVLSLTYIFVMNDCMPWPVLDFYALALLDTCVLCITLPAVKKGLAFCCIDWTRYTPALTSSTGAAKRASLASLGYEEEIARIVISSQLNSVSRSVDQWLTSVIQPCRSSCAMDGRDSLDQFGGMFIGAQACHARHRNLV